MADDSLTVLYRAHVASRHIPLSSDSQMMSECLPATSSALLILKLGESDLCWEIRRRVSCQVLTRERI